MSRMTKKERAALGLATSPDAPSDEPDRTAVDHPPAEPIDPATVPCRWSNLKWMGESGQHYLSAVQSSMAPPSKAMRIGRAIHSLLLGNTGAVVLYTGKVRNGKVWEAFAADQDPEAEILIASEMGTCREMRTAIERHRPEVGPSAMELLSEGDVEVGITWTRNGKACRGKPDVAGRRLVELKSCFSANPVVFPRHAEKLAYHGQCAWYEDALAANGKRIDQGSWIVAVESKRPFSVQVYSIAQDVLDAGRLMGAQWFNAMLECERTGVWTSYAPGPVAWDSVWSMGGGFELKMGDGKEN